MLSTHRLGLLVELHRRGTVSEVARALSYSPSTISQQLAHLEREAGSQLLEPVGRRVRLTNAGELLVKHAERILIQVDRAESELAALRSEISGDLRVATFQTATLALLPSLLEDMGQLHPDVRVFVSEIQPDRAIPALLARDFDLVLGETYPGPPSAAPASLHLQRLSADPLLLYAADRLVGERTSLGDFATSPWVMEPTGKPARAWAESICRTAGFEPAIRFESADLMVHRRLAETGHAVAMLPNLVWVGQAASGRLLSLPGDPAREVYTAVRLGAEERPVLQEFRRVLASVSERLTHKSADVSG